MNAFRTAVAFHRDLFEALRASFADDIITVPWAAPPHFIVLATVVPVAIGQACQPLLLGKDHVVERGPVTRFLDPGLGPERIVAVETIKVAQVVVDVELLHVVVVNLVRSDPLSPTALCGTPTVHDSSFRRTFAAVANFIVVATVVRVVGVRTNEPELLREGYNFLSGHPAVLYNPGFGRERCGAVILGEISLAGVVMTGLMVIHPRRIVTVNPARPRRILRTLTVKKQASRS